MIIVMEPKASQNNINTVVRVLENNGFKIINPENFINALNAV